MSQIHRVLPKEVEPSLRRTLNHIYDLLEKSSNGNGTREQRAAIRAEVQSAVGLIGGFAQPLVGDAASSDPLLGGFAQTPGTGTVTNVSRVNTAAFLSVSVANPTTTPVITFSANPATGWSLPTGAVSRAAFDESTVTLPQLAQRVAALITDLFTKQHIAA